MQKKYELLTDDVLEPGVAVRCKLFRIRALRDFGEVKKGDLGGYVQSEANLSHDLTAWIYGRAIVGQDAHVSGDAQVRDYAQVAGKARVRGRARVCDSSRVFDQADIDGDA
jgi:hypothetical protein